MEKKINIQSISASSRWLQCTASLKYNKDFVANINTLKGNLIHEVSALRLEEIFFGKDNAEKIEALKTKDYIDEKSPKLKTKWDIESQRTSDSYIDYAVRLYQQYQPHTIEIEKKVNVRWYGYEKYGLIDLVMVNDDYTIIVDLKSGRTPVDTYDNTQMLIYAIGKMQEYGKQTTEERTFYGNYIITICQPLLNNKVAVEYSRNSLVRFYQSHRIKMEEIISGNLQYDPTPNACKWCDYRSKCSERIKKGVI